MKLNRKNRFAQNVFILSLIMGAVTLLNGCKSPIPHHFSRKTDIEPFEVNDESAASRILIASRSSEYKDEIVHRVSDQLGTDDMYINAVGVNALKEMNAEEYDAVLIINTAVAWTLDPKVQEFIDRFYHIGGRRLATGERRLGL